MPTITDVEAQQHDPERVSVFLDGKFAFGTTLMAVYSQHLSVGRELSDDEVAALRRDDEVDRAFAAALNFLSFRPRSVREVRDYFRKRKTESAVAEAVVERLAAAGFLDDAEFARFWVENRQSFRPRGTRALRAELRQKGLDSDSIETALEVVGDEEEVAIRAGERKAASLTAMDEREFLTRMLGFLQRRGFPYAVASSAARRLYRRLNGEETDLLSEL